MSEHQTPPPAVGSPSRGRFSSYSVHMTTAPFSKCPRTDDELIDIMVARGLMIEDRDRARSDLRAIGYHRLGGYRYPLRLLLPEDERNPHERRFRKDEFIAGASHAQVMKLYEFDLRLREVILKGVLDYEIRLRAALIRVLSRRGAHAHLDIPRGSLDARKVDSTTTDSETTLLERWKETVDKARNDERNSDAVAHHLIAYPDSELPIWIALSLVSFGSLPYLMDLMRDEDRNEVARMFGVRNGKALTRWTRAFADLRNASAHNKRVFNSNIKRKFPVRRNEVPEGKLAHLTDMPPESVPGEKIYAHLALLAYVLTAHPRESNWHRTLLTCVRKFPGGITDGSGARLGPWTLGFPADWESLSPWAD